MAEAPITVFVDGAGRDALPHDPRQRVRWSCPLYRLRR
jgi:hypothetical protein